MVRPLSETPGFKEVSPSVIQQEELDPIQTAAISNPAEPVTPEPRTPTPQARGIDPAEKEKTVVKPTESSGQVEASSLTPDTSALEIEIPDFSSILDAFSDPAFGMEQKEVDPPIVDNPYEAPELEGYQSVLGKILNKPSDTEDTGDTKKRGRGMAALISPGERTPEQVAELSDIQFEALDPVDVSEIVDQTPQTSGNWNFGKMSANSLVIHHTAGRGEVGGVVQTFKDRGFPAHFVIDRKGEIHQILGIDQKGQHVRPSEINDVSNSNSWGVEIIAKDDDDVTPTQVKASLRLAKFLNQKHGMPLDRVFGHGEINSHKQETEGRTVLSLLGK